MGDLPVYPTTLLQVLRNTSLSENPQGEVRGLQLFHLSEESN